MNRLGSRASTTAFILGALGAGCSSQADGPTLFAPADEAPAVAASARSNATALPDGTIRHYEAGPTRLDRIHRADFHRQSDEAGIAITGKPLPVNGWLGAADLQDAYGVSLSHGPATPPTIAIIGGADDPNAEADLNAYRTQYGMAPCTTANGCFRKVNAQGAASPLPPAAPSFASNPTGPATWATEMANDLEMASTGCPTCKILLVESELLTPTDDTTAWETALNLGATYVSESALIGEAAFGPPPANPFTSPWDSFEIGPWFLVPGVSFFASSGDGGFAGGTGWPATSAHVTAVGGTALAAKTAAPWWSQSAWAGAGAGCSTVIPQPSWQPSVGCPGTRAVSDASAVATDVAVLDTWSSNGWILVAGTSVSTPLVAGLYAHNGWTGGPTFPYAHPASFTDITTGNDGTCAGSPTAFCNAGTGWDGPTGIGTPIAAAPVHELYASPNHVSIPAGSVGSVQIAWSGQPANAPASCSVVSQSLPAGVSGDCFELQGELVAAFDLDYSVPATPFVATVVSSLNGETRAVEVHVTPTACVPLTTAACGVEKYCDTDLPNGCGGTVTCGGCAGDDVCRSGLCYAPGSPCPAGKILKNGVCVYPTVP